MPMGLIRLVFSALLLSGVLFIPLSTSAAIETYEFDNNVMRERYQRFTDELRCPKCPNQNLSGSDSPIARDLRRELHRLLQQEKTDQQIIDYMVARYGEFVLYRPRLSTHTAVLWGAPVFFSVLGAGVLLMIVMRQKKKASATPQQADLSLQASEREQLDNLLRDETRGAANEQKSTTIDVGKVGVSKRK